MEAVQGRPRRGSSLIIFYHQDSWACVLMGQLSWVSVVLRLQKGTGLCVPVTLLSGCARPTGAMRGGIWAVTVSGDGSVTGQGTGVVSV